MSNELVAVSLPAPINVDGELRLELTDVDIQRLSPRELQAMYHALEQACVAQAAQGVYLLGRTWHDQGRGVLCIAFVRATDE